MARWRTPLRSKLTVAGSALCITVVALSLLAPVIAPFSNLDLTADLLQPPSAKYMLGTDAHGRDLLSRILLGGGSTLLLAVSVVAIACTIGTLWGLTAAYLGRPTSTVLTRAMDVVLSFPPIMLALLVLAMFSAAGTAPLILGIAICYAPRIARVIRGAALPVLAEDFVLAEKALGASHMRILFLHVLPNLVGPIVVLATIYLPYSIMLESTLSFLGIGAPPDVPTWGRIIAEGKAYIQRAPWLTFFPGITIMLAALSFNLLGDGLRDVIDPRSSTRLFN